MEEDTIRDRVKTKSGVELFRELVRQLPIVNVDDYYKNGTWLDELMRLDCGILAMHRAVAGAPDVLPLEEVKVPDMPVAKAPGMPYGMAGVRPGMPGVVGVVPPKSAAMAASAVNVTADLRQIALFVSKWKLEPTSTKALLARLTPGRRRFVMMNFKESLESASAENGDTSPIAKLEAYITHCEKSDAWAGADALMAAGLANVSTLTAKAPGGGLVVLPPGTPGANGGVVVAPPAKRPLEGQGQGRQVQPKAGSPGAVAAGLQALAAAGQLSKAGPAKAPMQVPPPAR